MNASHKRISSIAKLGIVLITLVLSSSFLIFSLLSNSSFDEKELVVRAKFVKKDSKDYGELLEPYIKAGIKTKEGNETLLFLVDSGSTVSSLPYDYSQKLGYDITSLPRRTFKGYGNNTSFAYEGSMDVQIGEDQVTLPVVFTSEENTTPILGRLGFFDNYSIFFNHKENTVEVRK